MFTDKAQAIVDLAKDFAHTTGAKELNLASLTLAMNPAHRGGHSLGGMHGIDAGKVEVGVAIL